MEHVRVREDDVRPLADLPAPLGRRVAVVDRRPQPLQPELGERARLILRERLRRIEVERPRLRIARDRVEDRQVEGERLPRRRAGRDDDVLAALRRLPRLGLVAVERGDPVRDERGGDARIEVVGKRLERRLARRLDSRVRDLLALEQIRPARGERRHRCGRELALEARSRLRAVHGRLRLAVGEEDHRGQREHAVAAGDAQARRRRSRARARTARPTPRRAQRGAARSPRTACTTAPRSRRRRAPVRPAPRAANVAAPYLVHAYSLPVSARRRSNGTRHIASATIEPVIFDAPARRSTNVIGTSCTRSPARFTR